MPAPRVRREGVDLGETSGDWRGIHMRERATRRKKTITQSDVDLTGV